MRRRELLPCSVLGLFAVVLCVGVMALVYQKPAGAKSGWNNSLPIVCPACPVNKCLSVSSTTHNHSTLSLATPRLNCSAITEYAVALQAAWLATPLGARPPAHVSLDSKPPLVYEGSMRGQGIGRILVHAARTMVQAIALNRPFLIDLNQRDPGFVLRSFVTMGRIFWEVQDSEDFHPYFNASRDWYYPKNEGLPLHVANMDKQFLANEESNKHKYLWAASWGPWFGESEPKKIHKRMQDRFGCDEASMMSELSNVLFRPTARLRALHEKRAKRLNIPQHYGAIHIRSELMEKFSDAQYVQAMNNCITRTAFKGKWWLITDRDDFTHRLAPQTEFLYETAPPAPWKKQHTAFLDPFDHSVYQPSMLDWHALWAADAAIILRGAFGLSAAMGSQKRCRTVCNQERSKNGSIDFILCERD